ncbi:hypothetical protein GOV12_07005 [Candidatus Pacearchaeota archaeon]|nr:hypothetical protein [Candidatus Pacearchaeota archaeon]
MENKKTLNSKQNEEIIDVLEEKHICEYCKFINNPSRFFCQKCGRLLPLSKSKGEYILKELRK